MRRDYQQYSGYGPGGRNCTCCGPSPRHRKKFDRVVKKREKRSIQKRIERNIVELTD